MAKQTFTAGQVLTAAEMNSLQENDYNWTVTTKTASYTLAAGDEGTRIVMNNAGATTITVDDAIFSAGDVVWIHNIGAGTCTITAGTATVNTGGSLALTQYQGGQLFFTSASAALFFPAEQGGSIGTYIDYSGSITFGNFTLGNGTVNFAYYTRIGDFVHYAGQVTLGSTSSITGNMSASLPVTSNTRERGAGNAEFIDNGVGAFGGACHANGTDLGIYCYDETGAFVQNNTVIATRPFTWTTNDVFAWTVVYRAA